MRRLLILLAGAVALYGSLAYLALPALWRHYEHEPGLTNAPKFSTTPADERGDPLNVALFGTREELVPALIAAGWKEVAVQSDELLIHRTADLAFERATEEGAHNRLHLWETRHFIDDRPLWLGTTASDRSGKHLAPDIDTERDRLFGELNRAGRVRKLFQVTGVGARLAGRTGAGDRFYTDGEMDVAFLAPSAAPVAPTEALPNPPAVRFKDALFARLRPSLRSRAEGPPATQ